VSDPSDDAVHEARRRSFDAIADTYDEVRPGYPAAVFDALVASVAPPARVLEIGAGTGQATGALLGRGYQVVAIEPGRNLAARLAAKLGHRALTVRAERLEDWEVEHAAFDLAAAFGSFHWVDRAAAYRIIATALRPGGWLALAWNERLDDIVPGSFEDAVQPVYRRWAPSLAHAEQTPTHDWRPSIAASGLFGEAKRLSFPWSRRLDTATYLRLLDTYSNHRLLAGRERGALHAAIAALIEERFDGEVLEERETVLYLAPLRHTNPPPRSG
jgi:SAM-dependent methyltransferase